VTRLVGELLVVGIGDQQIDERAAVRRDGLVRGHARVLP
jgi:hypothetical protein